MRALILSILMISSMQLYCGPAFAGAFEVAPTTLYLAPGARSGVFYIVNRGAQPVAAQVEALDWQQSGVSEQMKPSETLMVSPPMTRLMPGQRQTVRLVIKEREGVQQERAFRLIVSELQDPGNNTEQSVQVLLQFSVPVFMIAGPKTAPKIEWSMEKNPDGSFLLTAHNDATRHTKLSNLTLVAGDGNDVAKAPESFSYILANASRQWRMKLPEEVMGKTLLLKARDESAGAIEASLFIPQR